MPETCRSARSNVVISVLPTPKWRETPSKCCAWISVWKLPCSFLQCFRWSGLYLSIAGSWSEQKKDCNVSISVLSEWGTWRGGKEICLHKLRVEREGIALSVIWKYIMRDIFMCGSETRLHIKCSVVWSMWWCSHFGRSHALGKSLCVAINQCPSLCSRCAGEKNDVELQLLKMCVTWRQWKQGLKSYPCSVLPLTSVKPGFTEGTFGVCARPCTQTAKMNLLFKEIQWRKAGLWSKGTWLCMSW